MIRTTVVLPAFVKIHNLVYYNILIVKSLLPMLLAMPACGFHAMPAVPNVIYTCPQLDGRWAAATFTVELVVSADRQP
jgi:hypothetical protein